MLVFFIQKKSAYDKNMITMNFRKTNVLSCICVNKEIDKMYANCNDDRFFDHLRLLLFFILSFKYFAKNSINYFNHKNTLSFHEQLDNNICNCLKLSLKIILIKPFLLFLILDRDYFVEKSIF
ncbi:hypothetical protein RFI_35406 [Reticulomyxa filosa]|uniref:Uncharacterized protein n=1 Tax=Reticulomyxa filosa TaxID=46433 RepID=X6LKY9_RETFI|nr:hypothetical protein RFI_35406 [Reticulomyxa filosa]|eukprot:ETO02031.1 hypothetical protein RFI_35406 [Reticulomyxa filosa]